MEDDKIKKVAENNIGLFILYVEWAMKKLKVISDFKNAIEGSTAMCGFHIAIYDELEKLIENDASYAFALKLFRIANPKTKI